MHRLLLNRAIICPVIDIIASSFEYVLFEWITMTWEGRVVGRHYVQVMRTPKTRVTLETFDDVSPERYWYSIPV